MEHETVRVAGCDLGKATARFVTGHVGAQGVRLDEPELVMHDGRLFEVFRDWYRRARIDECAALGATGAYAGELRAPALVLPEDGCQEAALIWLPEACDVLDLVSVGARGYGVLSRFRVGGRGNGAPAGPAAPAKLAVRYLENEKCSSGTGENIAKIAARFGLDLAQADALARSTTRRIPITARCSVFAKSEMTHYANQGKPTAELFAGYFESVARNVLALLARNRIVEAGAARGGPVLLVGGCARSGAFVAAFERLLGEPVIVPAAAQIVEVLGAVSLAAEHVVGRDALSPLPSNVDALLRRREGRFAVLPPARTARDRVTIMAKPSMARPPLAQGDRAQAVRLARPALLGLDLGSTGAKAVLTAIDDGEQLFDLYDRTRGNPVDASRRLLRALLDHARTVGATLDVRAIGLTGSGREAVATLLRAVYPQAQARIVTENEIVAHGTAALRCDPDGGRDLSVLEIGGQDAKYLRISGGRIVESDMNKACSAGTGSFLEEQAQLYDVHDIGEFARLAAAAERPPDLGQMCTVYVADTAAEALKDGFGLDDIFAGFQYSVIHNYLDRVMGQRTLASRVFLQGKPAENASLAWTLAQVTGREVTVPPNPGAMGAWGIGLCARSALGVSVVSAAPPLALEAALAAEIVARSEFACQDAVCHTLCPIERTTISVGGSERVAFSGGACPKFELARGHAEKLDKRAPDPFERRAELLRAHAGAAVGGASDVAGSATSTQTIAIPVTGALVGVVPWLATFVRELGFGVRLQTSDATTLARGEHLANAFDACSPTKIAHALCDGDAELLLFPKITEIGDVEGRGGQTCVTEQAMPDLAFAMLRARGSATRLLRPVMRFKNGPGGLTAALGAFELAAELGVSPLRATTALERATRAQRVFDEALLALGREALAYARGRGLPVVVVCGPRHVIHDRAVNATVPALLRQNGALAVPMDCYPIGAAAETPELAKIYWGDPNRYLRAALAARSSRAAFPLLLTSFGCGPASFAEQIFQSLLEGYPHTILESDGHGGTAGFVTRIQAFLRSVRQFRAEAAQAALPDNAKRLAMVEPRPRTGPYLDRSVRYVFMSSIDYLGDVFAAAYRAYGYDATTAPPITHENFNVGRRDCSGKECLSYQMLWGSFRQYLDDNPPTAQRETRLVQISGAMCRAGLFGLKDQLTLERRGEDDRVTVTALRVAGGPGMTSRAWTGIVAVDLLRQLYLYHLVNDAERAAALYHASCQRVITLLGQPVLHVTPLSGFAAGAQVLAQWREVQAIVREASAGYAALRRASGDRGDYPTVFVSGDIMTKGNDVANGGLYRELAARGVRVVVEPTGEFLAFLAELHPQLFFGKGTPLLQQVISRQTMTVVRSRLYAMVREQHPWLAAPDLAGVVAAAHRVVDTRTNGGAAMAIGSALHNLASGAFDGLVMTACWGCDNGLIAESLLRYHQDLPALFYYDDATPLDERRLSAFTFRLTHRAAKGAARRVALDADRAAHEVVTGA